MILIQPVHGITDQECPYLVSSVIEDQTLPIGVVSPSAIRMFVEVRPVKETKSVRILGKMGGYPIQNDPYPILVQGIYQKLKLLRFPESGRGRKIPGQLIAPGGIIGIFHNGHKFYM